MAQQLAMDKVQGIKSLAATGMSERQIARTLEISRRAVRRHLRVLDSKDTTAPTGSVGTGESAPIESSRSRCHAYQATILGKRVLPPFRKSAAPGIFRV